MVRMQKEVILMQDLLHMRKDIIQKQVEVVLIQKEVIQKLLVIIHMQRGLIQKLLGLHPMQVDIIRKQTDHIKQLLENIMIVALLHYL